MNHLFLHFPQKACGDLHKVRKKNTGEVEKKKTYSIERKIRIDFKKQGEI